MLKRRLMAVVTVRDGWAVQSFGYRRHLPLGKPEVLVENLDRWGADEILVQCIDRSRSGAGPDFEVIRRIGSLGIATPIVYAGGIRNREDAVKVVSCGADRLMIDAMLRDAPGDVEAVARDLGIQAVIAHLPVRSARQGLLALDYRSGQESSLDALAARLPLEWISELMLTDWTHEGQPEGFDAALLAAGYLVNKPLLCFGGISTARQIQKLMSDPRVVATGIGNFLSYREHAVQALKRELEGVAIRPPHYESTLV